MEEAKIGNQEMERNVEKISNEKLEGDEEEKRVIHVLEENGRIDYTKNANGDQKDENNKIDHSSKKIRKANPKTTVTVPRPFNLATEKRMTRERRGSMDFKETKPVFSRSASLNYKSSNLNGIGSSLTKTSQKPKVRTNEKDNKIIEKISSSKDNASKRVVEKNKLQVKDGDKLKNMPREDLTFKALPLPNFYRNKDSTPKTESKKMISGRSKTPIVGDQVKTLSKSANNKSEGNARKISRGIGGGAKETISKVVRTTKNSLKTTPKETTKDSV